MASLRHVAFNCRFIFFLESATAFILITFSTLISRSTNASTYASFPFTFQLHLLLKTLIGSGTEGYLCRGDLLTVVNDSRVDGQWALPPSRF